MKLAPLLRGMLVLLAAGSLVASATSQGPDPEMAPMVSTSLVPAQLVGPWNTDFGPVTFEQDPQAPGGMRGQWQYARPDGATMTGYFAGTLMGNVLGLRWNEPGVGGQPGLEGSASLTFGANLTSFTGTWQTTSGDRKGQWNGTRNGAPPAPIAYPQSSQPDYSQSQQPAPGQVYPQPGQPVPGQVYPPGQPVPGQVYTPGQPMPGQAYPPPAPGPNPTYPTTQPSYPQPGYPQAPPSGLAPAPQPSYPTSPPPGYAGQPAPGNSPNAVSPECRLNSDGSQSCGYRCQLSSNGRHYCASTPDGMCTLQSDGTFVCP